MTPAEYRELVNDLTYTEPNDLTYELLNQIEYNSDEELLGLIMSSAYKKSYYDILRMYNYHIGYSNYIDKRALSYITIIGRKNKIDMGLLMHNLYVLALTDNIPVDYLRVLEYLNEYGILDRPSRKVVIDLIKNKDIPCSEMLITDWFK